MITPGTAFNDYLLMWFEAQQSSFWEVGIQNTISYFVCKLHCQVLWQNMWSSVNYIYVNNTKFIVKFSLIFGALENLLILKLLV